MIVLNPKLFKSGQDYASQANTNVSELKKILSELTVQDPIVHQSKPNPSPEWINGKPKAGGTVWASETRGIKPKTFKL